MILWQIKLENKVTQEDPLEIQEALSQTAKFVDVVIRGTKSLAQPMVNFVLVVVREAILLRGKRSHFVERCMQKKPGKRAKFSKAKIHAVKEETREIRFLKPRYMQ